MIGTINIFLPEEGGIRTLTAKDLGWALLHLPIDSTVHAIVVEDGSAQIKIKSDFFTKEGEITLKFDRHRLIFENGEYKRYTGFAGLDLTGVAEEGEI